MLLRLGSISNLYKQNKPIRLFVTLLIGVCGGFVFKEIHVPLPWVLGPMTILMICSRLFKGLLFWSPMVRNLGLIIIGYNSGLSINNESLIQILRQLPWMLAVTTALVMFSAVTGILFAKLTGIDYPSILMGGIPGALSQIVTMGEEMEGTNLTVITLLQVVRIILLVSLVPIIIFSPLYSVQKSGLPTPVVHYAAASWDVLLPKIIVFTLISVLSVALAKKLRFPTPYLLGPILAIAVLSVSGLHGPKLSPVFLDVAQVSMGCHLGLLLKPEKLQQKVKILSLSIINSLIMILFSLGLSYILIQMHDLEPATAFLSAAPGGTDQMGLIASVISADVSLVTGYQLFRLLFVNFVVPPGLKWYHRYYLKTKQVDYEANHL